MSASPGSQILYAIPGRAEERIVHRIVHGSRQPGPGPEAEPVRDFVGPDPDEVAPIDRNLSHAFHSWPQAWERLIEMGFDAEVVDSILGD